MYPGFFPGFKSTGICINKPTQFIDTTNTRYGTVNSWTWDFGVPSVSTDTSHIQNPTFTYSAIGTYDAQLIVTSSKGCIDTVTTPITIIDKPPINLAFRDTLICNGDNLQLQASGDRRFQLDSGNKYYQCKYINSNCKSPELGLLSCKSQ